MTIILKTSPTNIKSTFLHIPKTGGMFVRKVLKDNGLDNEEILVSETYYTTSEYTTSTQHNIPFNSREFMDSEIVFSFVRNPITWYQSYWAFKLLIQRWHLNKPLDDNCRHFIFSKFMDNVLQKYPDGYLKNTYGLYTKMSTHVGKQEQLADDLALFLSEIGFDNVEIDRKLRINEALSKWKKLAKYRQDQIPIVISAEFDTMRRYNYETDPEYYQNDSFVK